MRLGIDFDGVIHNHKVPLEGKRMGAPIEGAKDSLLKLAARGDEIIVHTVKANSEDGRCAVIDFLHGNGKQFQDGLFANPFSMPVNMRHRIFGE